MKYVIVSCFLFSFYMVAGFSVKNHRLICEHVFAEYNSYLRHSGENPLSEASKDMFIKGNLDEDRKFIRKIRNWHFYDPSNTFPENESLNRRFKAILIHFDLLVRENKYPDSVWFVLGQITHYLQDMSVPPHVVPVYHGISDRFDDYKMECPQQVSADYIEALKPGNNIRSFVDLLNKNAKITLSHIADSISVLENKHVKKITWAYFWNASATNNFGNYGRLGNSFGKTKAKFRPAWYVRKKKYKIDKQLYRNFFNEQVRHAQDITITAIFFATNLIAINKQ